MTGRPGPYPPPFKIFLAFLVRAPGARPQRYVATHNNIKYKIVVFQRNIVQRNILQCNIAHCAMQHSQFGHCAMQHDAIVFAY